MPAQGPVSVAAFMPVGYGLDVRLEFGAANESKARTFLNLDCIEGHQPFLAVAMRWTRAVATATCSAVRRVEVGCTNTLIGLAVPLCAGL